MNRAELYVEYRQRTIEKGINPIGKKRFNGIVDTLQEIEQLQLGGVSKRFCMECGDDITNTQYCIICGECRRQD